MPVNEMKKFHLQFFLLDAFVDPKKPFSGNPAAVVLMENDTDIPDSTKLKIAAEFNSGITVFLSSLSTSSNQFLIRWFVEDLEVKLCGHGALAAAYLLGNFDHSLMKFVSNDKPIEFVSKSGEKLSAALDGDFVTMNLALNPTKPLLPSDTWIEDVKRALFDSEDYVFEDVRIRPWQGGQGKFLLVRLRNDASIHKLKPNFGELAKIQVGLFGMLVTQKADFEVDGAHFWARMLFPWVGMNEDHTCGSAMTVATPYWNQVYREQYNQTISVFYAKFASKRGGSMSMQIEDNRLVLTGRVNHFGSGILSV